jgi:fused signal recognition particle receptor
MILWWGKKKQPDPATGETPVEPLKPGERPASPVANLDQQLFGNTPAMAQPPADEDDDPIGLKKAAARIAAERAAEAAAREASVLHKLSEGLRRSSSRLAEGLAGLNKRKIDRASLDELEDLLITSDMGVKVAARISAAFSKDRFDREITAEEIRGALATEIAAILKAREKVVDFAEGPKPRIVLFVGVNGSGKTTTIGKIASKLSAQGADIVVAAGDTFRAAAVEQLAVWADRNGVPLVSQATGADPAAVVFDALKAARARGVDVLIADTAGRLHTQSHLMDELAKVARVIKRLDPEAPHEVLLVLDAGLGQNALRQAEQFHKAIGVSGMVVTKLDGTARGGIVVAIARRFGLPIRFVGVGEQADDFGIFDARAYVDGLLRPAAGDPT